MAPEMSIYDRYSFSMHFDPSYPPANRVFVFDFWQNNTSVKELDFYRNNIGNEGVKAIAKMLEVGS